MRIFTITIHKVRSTTGHLEGHRNTLTNQVAFGILYRRTYRVGSTAISNRASRDSKVCLFVGNDGRAGVSHKAGGLGSGRRMFAHLGRHLVITSNLAHQCRCRNPLVVGYHHQGLLAAHIDKARITAHREGHGNTLTHQVACCILDRRTHHVGITAISNRTCRNGKVSLFIGNHRTTGIHHEGRHHAAAQPIYRRSHLALPRPGAGQRRHRYTALVGQHRADYPRIVARSEIHRHARNRVAIGIGHHRLHAVLAHPIGKRIVTHHQQLFVLRSPLVCHKCKTLGRLYIV